MNQHLQALYTFLQESTHLNPEEKAALLKSIKDVDKEMEIALFKLDRTEKVKRTTAILLEETIQELEQKRKAIEKSNEALNGKNRELEIESSLERVRSVAMAMRKPDDMLEVCRMIAGQLETLGVPEIRNVQTAIIDGDGKGKYMNYQYFAQYHEGTIEHVEINKHPKVREMIDQMKQAPDAFFSACFEGRELNEWRQYRRDDNQFPDPILEKADAIHFYFYSIGEGGLGISVYAPLPPEGIELFHRFRNVFALSYQRFRDIEQAEAQAREARIEAALEKVRSRTMAMHKSDELKEVIHVVYEQFVHLNILIEHAGFIMDYHTRNDMHIWLADQHEVPSQVTIPYFDCAHWNSFNEAKEKGLDFFANLLSFEEKNNFYRDLFTLIPGVPEETLDYYFNCPGLAISTVLLENVGLYIENFSGIPYSDEENATLMRFGKVFQQTYTRFLDLQKAEAQAREAQIEAALERVRSRSLAMHHSNEMEQVIGVISEQLLQLEFRFHNASFVRYTDRKGIHFWLAAPGQPHPYNVEAPYLDHPIYNRPLEKLAEGNDFHSDVITAEENREWLNHLFTYSVLKNLPEEDKQQLLHTKGFARSLVLMKHISLVIGNYAGIPYTDEQNAILRRFGNVFEQAYTRFLDLQKAEAQAREAHIEAALERVRAKAMAMHSSEDLALTVDAFFSELKGLGVTPHRCGVGINDLETRSTQMIATTATHENETKKVSGILKLSGHPVLDNIFEHWLQQKEYHPVLRGQEILEYYTVMNPQVDVPTFSEDEIQFGYYFFFKEGGVFAWTDKEYGDEILNIFRKFTSVLSLTHRRYMDLKEAEAQTREAQIEAGLERVRSRTMAMQSCDELAETAAVVLHELVKLGLAPNRLYIAIIENTNTDIHFYLTNEDGGKDCSVYTAQFEKNISVQKMYDGWAAHHSSITLLLEGDELTTYLQYLRDEVGVPFKNTNVPLRRVHSIAYFSQGYIGIVSHDDQPEETTKLLERFAAVFNLTYTRFNDLKQAEKLANQAKLDLIRLKEEKARTELALTELKATQAQLIQSEKMASLGELTAGIAHEIQNPLNFVNNFSEVSHELLDEMKEELAIGNKQQAMDIANDVKENLEKVLHHGKRADAIVKGMLMHSRTGSGVKEPTDINALCEEYLRLAYHGLRAKDKSFNAKMKTDFDDSIRKIEIIPQDIGRVILNLITNAFYAVSAPKSPEGELPFEPTVTITTKKISLAHPHSNTLRIGGRGYNGIEISVKDNGPGIPQHILDKIFQPFFTTKPTGQGTGLGLSLSYDIVKAHGGELKVETKEGEGAEFIIQLPVV